MTRCEYCKSKSIHAELLIRVDNRSKELSLCKACYQAAVDALQARLILPSCGTCNNASGDDEARCLRCMRHGEFEEWEAR